MAQDEPNPRPRQPISEKISPSIEQAIERTWPSPKDPAGDPAEPATEVHARVRRFFVRVLDNTRKLRKTREAQRARSRGSQIAQAQARAQGQGRLARALAEAKAPASPPAARPQPSSTSKPKPKPAGPSLAKTLGIFAASLGAAVLIGKTISALSERKRPPRRLRFDLDLADEFDDDEFDESEDETAVTFHYTTHSTVIDADAIETITPALKSFVTEAVSKSFDERQGRPTRPSTSARSTRPSHHSDRAHRRALRPRSQGRQGPQHPRPPRSTRHPRQGQGQGQARHPDPHRPPSQRSAQDFQGLLR